MASQDPAPAAGQAPSIDPGTGHAQNVEARVIAQAVRDPAFRARVVADPKAVFAELGLRIPAEIEIQVVQETDEHYYLVLPQTQGIGGAGASLSDAELEAVAGGTVPDTCNTCYGGWTGCASGQSGCVATVGYCPNTSMCPGP